MSRPVVQLASNPVGPGAPKMSRRKKTRSLKRIHSVKTGSLSKQKKASQTDRQHKGRYSKKNDKQKSVFAKFVEAQAVASEDQPKSTPVKRPTTDRAAPKSQTAQSPNGDKSPTKAASHKPDLFDAFENRQLNKDLY